MKQLEKLPEIASRQLGGLHADDGLLQRIRQEAQSPSPRRKAAAFPMKPLLCCAAALVVLLCGLFVMPRFTAPDDELIYSHSAGGQATKAPLSGDLGEGSLSMSSSGSRSGESLFAPVSGNTFPLIIVDGATYRMLSSPSGISDGLLGAELGSVGEFNIEPALGTSAIVSNTVGQGDTVYAVKGLSGAMVAAPVNGSYRVFQRVSYAGAAVFGGETLRDTLAAPDMVSWIFISGLGTVSGDDAAYLLSLLYQHADYQSTGTSGSVSMQIGLKNGLVLQLMTGDECISGCGTWSCPEFFEGFHEALGY